MLIRYPDEVKKISEILNKNGHSVYAVGGCIRDALMGRTPNDWDLTTSCSPDEMLQIFEREGVRTLPTGLRHGTLTVILNGVPYECTTYRIDGSYSDSRHPDKVEFTKDVAQDLKRRDFTVNAMAGNPLSADGSVVDLFGGKDDIEKKIIRAVGEAEKRFNEDALRILRAVRFAATLGFEIEEKTKNAAKAASGGLLNVSAERKSAELFKILASDGADRGISLLLETDGAKYIHKDIKQPKIKISDLPQHLPTRLASLFDSMPDLSGMKLSNEISRETRLLCDNSLFESCFEGENREICARLALSKYASLAENAAILHGQPDFAEEIKKEREKNPPVAVSQLKITGNDLKTNGFEQKKIGLIMNALLSRVIQNPSLNEGDSLLKAAKEIISNGKDG